jgi:endo-1,4-beta-xylanase
MVVRKRFAVRGAWLAIVVSSSCCFVLAAEPATNELPNPFVFSDGSAVRTPEDWQRRRTELKSLFEECEYGHLPPKPEKMTVVRGEAQEDEVSGITRETWKLNLEHNDKTIVLNVNLTLPKQADGPVPLVVQGAFGGPGRPNRLSVFTDHGYAVAEVNFMQIVNDNREHARESGIYELFGADLDCGALMAWAWGMHRVIDALEQDDRIDTGKIVVTGHSRYGKAALVAGAFDERIALTVPSHSGCAGSAPFRFIYGNSEQLQNIVGFAPHWFRPDFNRFVGKVDELPLDQHMLKALVAPRALLATEGTEDAWTNPEGSQLTNLAAAEVYRFLGAGDRLSIRFRPVGHVPSNEDLIEFADHVFFDKPLSAEFRQLAYPEAQDGFSWRAPK